MKLPRQVIEYGGLFPFNVARMQGKVFLPPIKNAGEGARRQAGNDGGGENLRAGTCLTKRAKLALAA